MNENHTYDEVELGTLGEDLPRLALRAATELDELCLGRHSDLASVKSLANVLRNSFLNSSDLTTTKSYIDSANIAVLSHALSDCHSEAEITTVGDLVTKALEIADQLVKAGNENRTVLEQQRDFCVALSNAANSYCESVYDPAPAEFVMG